MGCQPRPQTGQHDAKTRHAVHQPLCGCDMEEGWEGVWLRRKRASLPRGWGPRHKVAMSRCTCQTAKLLSLEQRSTGKGRSDPGGRPGLQRWMARTRQPCGRLARLRRVPKQAAGPDMPWVGLRSPCPRRVPRGWNGKPESLSTGQRSDRLFDWPASGTLPRIGKSAWSRGGCVHC